MTQSGKDISKAASTLARRMTIHAISQSISTSMILGAGIAVILVVIGKFVAIPVPIAFAVGGVLFAGLIAGAIRGILARVSVLEAAAAADMRLDLKERLSSALELLEEENRREMAELQLGDAADYARSLDPRVVCPRMFPMTARILPAALLILVISMYVLSPYGQAAQIPEGVRQAIEQAGIEMESAVGEMDKDALSSGVAKLASEIEDTGRKLQDKPLTKREALRELSNLAQKAEALKMMGEMAEKLKGDMTPEKKRALSELLKKLADSLKDIPEMAELSKEVLEAQQANLSADSLKKLAAALEQMGIEAADMKALEKMLEQLIREKRDVGQSMARAPKDIGENEPTNLKPEEESGLMGSGAPGKKAARDMKEEAESASQRPIPSNEGYDSELEGQLSATGKSASAGDKSEPEAGESSVPYEKIYMEYRNTADDAIARPEIPWMYKEHVKNYFDAIKPKEK